MPRQRRKGGSSFSLLGRRPPDEDEELARARFELTRLETQYIEAAKAVDRLSQSRKGTFLYAYIRIVSYYCHSNVFRTCRYGE